MMFRRNLDLMLLGNYLTHHSEHYGFVMLMIKAKLLKNSHELMGNICFREGMQPLLQNCMQVL